MHPIVILGSGGFAREVAWLIEEINLADPQWEILGFSGSSQETLGETVGKYQVKYTDEMLVDSDVALAVGVGDPGVLRKLNERFSNVPRERFPNLIHPSVRMHREGVKLGVGNIICAGNILTTDITIGSFNVFNLACTLGHDCKIGDCCVINPGCNISGGVRVSSGCLIGTGATVLQGLRIGAWATVGAGAVVTRDVNPHTTVVGVPARAFSRGETSG